MYLLHLVTRNPIYDPQTGKLVDGHIPVRDPDSGSLLFWADIQTITERIRAGTIKPHGSHRCVRELHWIGPRLTIVPIAEEQAGYKPSGWRKIRYSYDYETDSNPKNVWALYELPNHTQAIFLAVAASCGGVRALKKKRRPS